jgi:Cu2+-exporting ATPase
MHPEIIQEGPGSCPICGMDLVPMKPTESEDNKTYLDLLRKMKIAHLYTAYFYHCHVRYDSNNPLMQVMDISMELGAVCIITTSSFCSLDVFVRAWKSIISWNLNMFTLIGIGAGLLFFV